MMRHHCSFAMMLMLLMLAGPARAQDGPLTLESAPPVVVRTVPETGAEGVDPATAEIRVTFSKTMRDGSWSWVNATPETQIKLTGDPSYREDRKTCVVPVKLGPGKTYAIWLNTQKFRNFKDEQGQPALPYLLVFKTRNG